MQDTNWNLVQFKYEMLGYSLENLAREHNLSTAVLEYNAKSWKQISLEQDASIDMDSIKSIEDVLTKLNSQVINQTQAFQILKQKFLGSKYIELETILLQKAISLASNITDTDIKAASILKSLTETLTYLIAQNPLLKSDVSSNDDKEEDKVWEVRFVGTKPEEKEKNNENDKNN